MQPCPPMLPPSTQRTPEAGWTAGLAAYAAALRYDDLPDDVTHRVKLTLVDTLGVTLAAGASALGQQIAQAACALNPGQDATVFSAGHTASAAGAALANASLSDMLEWQDGWRFG